jgi:hypothetical protein
MFTDTPRTGLRALGALGATMAVIATLLPWYAFDVVFITSQIAHTFEVPITLWGLTTVAPIVIVVAAVGSLIALALVDSRAVAIFEGLVGLGVLAYGIYRCIDIPSLGVIPANAPANIHAATILETGPLVAITAGLMLAIAAAGELLVPDTVPEGPATAAGPADGAGARVQPGEARRVPVR